MNSAVEFATETRVHVGLSITNLESALPFYEALFGQPPTKRRDGYAKFEVASPPVNLTLNEIAGYVPEHGPANHFGIQVKSSDEVASWRDRMSEAGFPVRSEDAVACCFATQDKVWIEDPDGHRWEVFVVLDDTLQDHGRGAKASPASATAVSETDTSLRTCCEPTCCA